jgi:hypothetical protein
MSRPPLLAIASIAILIAGCANFNTIDRSTDLPGGGKAIHLDAPQRLVFTNSTGDVCAEPSPDALQAYAASFNGSGKTASGVEAQLAAAFSETSGSIGLRTQAITLMRDALYRICEAHHNNAIGELDTVLLMERSQDLTLGILAIEQLTGAVVARQVTLSAGPNASAAKNANDTSAALDAAQKDESTKKDALTKATDAQTKQQTVVDADAKTATESAAKAKPAQDNIDKLKSAVTEDQKTLASQTSQATEADKTAKANADKASKLKAQLEQLTKANPLDKAAIQKATADLGAAQTDAKKSQDKSTALKDGVTKQAAAVDKAKSDLATAEKETSVAQASKDAATLKEANATLLKDTDAVTADKKAYELAQKVTAAIQANVDSAVKTAQDVADGKGSFSTGVDRDNINQYTVAKISEATATIVDKVLNKGHLTDACINLLTAFSRNALANTDDSRVQTTLDLCSSVINTDLANIMPGGPEALRVREALRAQ